MINKSLLLIFISLVFFSCKNVLSLEEKMLKVEEKKCRTNNCKIDSTIEGNFTNSGYREILVFFNLILKNEKTITKNSTLFVIDDTEKIINVYDVYYKNRIVDDRNFIKEIDKFNICYNNAIISDFNGNGKLELIYFVGEGSCFTFYIEEFKNDKFEDICPTYNPELNLPGIYNYDLTHFDFETKSIYLSDRESSKKIKLTWNPETEFYEKEVLEE